MSDRIEYPPLEPPPADETQLAAYRADIDRRVLALLRRYRVTPDEEGIQELTLKFMTSSANAPGAPMQPWFPDDAPIDKRSPWIDIAFVRKEEEIRVVLPSERETGDEERLAYIYAVFLKHRYLGSKDWAWIEDVLAEPVRRNFDPFEDSFGEPWFEWQYDPDEPGGRVPVYVEAPQRPKTLAWKSQTLRRIDLPAAALANKKLSQVDTAWSEWIQQFNRLSPADKQMLCVAIDNPQYRGKESNEIRRPDMIADIRKKYADLLRRLGGLPRSKGSIAEEIEAEDKARTFASNGADGGAGALRKKVVSMRSKGRQGQLTDWAADLMFASGSGATILAELRLGAQRIIAE